MRAPFRRWVAAAAVCLALVVSVCAEPPAQRQVGGRGDFDAALSVLSKYETRLHRQLAAQMGERSVLELPRKAWRLLPGFLRKSGGGLGGGAAYQRPGVGQQPADVQRAIATLYALADDSLIGDSLAEDVLFAVADMELYGRFGTAVRAGAAFARYRRLCALSGNATAHYMVGFFHATGLGAAPRRNGLALLHTTLAAAQGHAAAQATLGFRAAAGIGAAPSCADARAHYGDVARAGVQHWLAGPPLGRHMPGYRARLADDRGGAYGVRTGPHALHRATTRAAFAELLAVHRFNARAGNARAALTLADVLYHGHRFHARDLPGARAVLAGLAATLFADKDADSDVAAQAAGMLGVMCWRGEGGPRDTAAALRWLRAGAALGHGASLNALGAMHRDGVEVPADAARAQALFKQAAAAHHAGGQVNYALAVRAAQPGVARALLRAAAESGHVLAHYHVGLEHAAARGEAECRMAVASFRFVAERADWLHSPIAAAEAAAARGDAEAAAVRYMQAAEMGYDVGQANAAVLLDMLCEDGDRGRSLFPSPNTTTRSPTQSSCSRAALVYWTRAANQNVADARAKQGDAYYYGRGVARSYERAAAAYALAARADANGLAMWNLGWMHEHGVGVPQDFHLAKRWYDQSLAANPAGRLAAHASLARLGLRYLWAWARGRDVGEGPLFFAPRPVTLEEEETHQQQQQQQQQQRKRANNNNDDPSGDDSDETPPGADGSLSESAFFVALLLAAAWMFLPLR